MGKTNYLFFNNIHISWAWLYGHRMVRFKASLELNNLWKSLTDIRSFDSFKKKLKLYLISYYKYLLSMISQYHSW